MGFHWFKWSDSADTRFRPWFRLVAHLFDERNQGVKRMVKMAIATAKKNGCKIGICGQAPATEFAQFLVELGLTWQSEPWFCAENALIAEVEAGNILPADLVGEEDSRGC